MKAKLIFNGDKNLKKPKSYTKCHFPAQPILLKVVKMPFIGQPDNFIC